MTNLGRHSRLASTFCLCLAVRRGKSGIFICTQRSTGLAQESKNIALDEHSSYAYLMFPVKYVQAESSSISVPFIFETSAILFSCNNRRTDGKSGRSWEISLAFMGWCEGGGLGGFSAGGSRGFLSCRSRFGFFLRYTEIGCIVPFLSQKCDGSSNKDTFSTGGHLSLAWNMRISSC
jgi:hypothetical protein